MNISIVSRLSLVLIGLLLLGGCASHAPSIAHTHIGHSLTGWVDTPNKEGLLVTAERSAQTALRTAENAAASGNDLARIKSEVALLVAATDPTDDFAEAQASVVVYGVKNALTGAINHVIYAAESPDASANMKAGAAQLARHASAVQDRCALIKALGGDIAQSSSVEEAELLTQELLKMSRANVDGEDSNNDGVVGSSPEEYGLKQIRGELQAILDRENPPYTTVESWYLFNLIRLPTGEWMFRQGSAAGASSSRGGY